MSDPTFSFTRRGMLLVLSAPSGGGKSVVLRRMLAEMPGLRYSVSVTSRPPRGNEVEGEDYYFVSRERFEEMVEQDLFYEWAEVHGNLYGTRRDTVEAALGAGEDLIMDIDVKGGHSVKFSLPETVLIFLMPPSFDVLEERLRTRDTDSGDEIQKRLDNARAEVPYWQHYDYVVVNRDLDEAIESVKHILLGERCRAKRLSLPGEG